MPDESRAQILESDEPYDKTLWGGGSRLGWLGTAIPKSSAASALAISNSASF
jgi:hypothetical protein